MYIVSQRMHLHARSFVLSLFLHYHDVAMEIGLQPMERLIGGAGLKTRPSYAAISQFCVPDHRSQVTTIEYRRHSTFTISLSFHATTPLRKVEG